MALLDDLGTALETASVTGGATGWTLFKSFMPDNPDKAVAIYETGGQAPMTGTGNTVDLPRFQIKVRGEGHGYSVAREKLRAAFNALHEQEVAVGSDYIYINAISDALSLGQDERHRPMVVQNYQVMKAR